MYRSGPLTPAQWRIIPCKRCYVNERRSFMETNIGNLLSLSALRNPHKTAVFCEDQRITYKDLDKATSSMAQWLLAQGCRPGDRIALYWPNSIDLVKLLFACFKARMVAVPIYTQMKAAETAHILVQSNAKMCSCGSATSWHHRECGARVRMVGNDPPFLS